MPDSKGPPVGLPQETSKLMFVFNEQPARTGRDLA